MSELLLWEAEDLARYEAVIDRGFQTFVEVGMALLAIRDGRLYRPTHETFEEYCRDRWGMTRQYAKNLVHAAQVVENLRTETMVSVPENERQARPLATLPASKQAEAWNKAVETAPNGKVTAAHVASVVETFREPEAEAPVEPDLFPPEDESWDEEEPEPEPEEEDGEEPEPEPPPRVEPKADPSPVASNGPSRPTPSPSIAKEPHRQTFVRCLGDINTLIAAVKGADTPREKGYGGFSATIQGMAPDDLRALGYRLVRFVGTFQGWIREIQEVTGEPFVKAD